MKSYLFAPDEIIDVNHGFICISLRQRLMWGHPCTFLKTKDCPKQSSFPNWRIEYEVFYICIQYHFFIFHFRYISCCRLKIWRRKADDLQHVLCTWCCSCLHCYRKGTTLDNFKWYFHSFLTLNKHYLHESVVGWNLITKYKSIFQCKKYYNAKWWHSALVQVKAFVHRSSMFSGQTVLFEGSFIISLYHNKRQIALFSNPFI